MPSPAASKQPAELLEIARAAARAASELLLTARPDAIKAKSNPRDLVTEWDVRSEELIRKILEDRAPGIPILGEEGGLGRGRTGADGDGDRDDARAARSAGTLRWLVDPIDGTVNFAHGLPIWSISIAIERLADEGDQAELLAGVVAAPKLGWWFEASKGGGARDADGRELRVSAIERLEDALLVTGFPYDMATNPLNNLADFEHMSLAASAVRRLGSASLDVCTVAAGWLDGYWERHLQAWDVGAGALIALEAGATITNLRGQPFDLHAGEIVVSNGAIHEQMIAALAAVPR